MIDSCGGRVVCNVDPLECVALELCIAIPTPSDPTDWDYTKEFVVSIIRRLSIGNGHNEIQVGVVTYRGLSHLAYFSITSLASRLSLLKYCSLTSNSAIADKPRDAFVQMQWRG